MYYIIILVMFERLNNFCRTIFTFLNESLKTFQFVPIFWQTLLGNVKTSSTWTTLYRVQSKCCRRRNTWVEMTLNQTILIGHSHFLMTHLIFIFRRKKGNESKRKKFVKWQWLRKKRIIRKVNRDWDFGLNEVEKKLNLGSCIVALWDNHHTIFVLRK